MKNKVFSVFALAVILLFAACKKEEPGVISLTLDKETASVQIGSTITLVATVDPAGSTIKWESSNTSIATVDGGIVKGIAEGTAHIVATSGTKTASCMVTVVKQGGSTDPINPDLPSSLQGTEYYIIQLDGISSSAIESRIVADFRADDVTKFLYIWTEGDALTYDAVSTVGLNFYGEAEEWVAMTVKDKGWSGFGYAIDDLEALNKLSAIMESPDDYYFHIAMKSTDKASHLFGLTGTAGEVKFCIGSTPFEDNGTSYKPYKDITRDGEWNEIEIPMSYFIDKGLTFGANNSKGANVFWGLSGGTPGVVLQYDACFIYKKAK